MQSTGKRQRAADEEAQYVTKVVSDFPSGRAFRFDVSSPSLPRVERTRKTMQNAKEHGVFFGRKKEFSNPLFSRVSCRRDTDTLTDRTSTPCGT